MTLYKGNAKIRDEGSYGVYHGSDPIVAIFKGSQKVYQFQRQLTWQAGTSLASYTVPSYVTKIRVDCVASKGKDYGRSGGNGGRVQCDIDVTGGQTFYITVGSIPAVSNTASYNAADIRTNNAGQLNNTSLQSRLVVAGGGGNGGYSAVGGLGGGLTGGNGGVANGTGQAKGGTQSSGGEHAYADAFATNGTNGTFGLGGNGGDIGGAGGAGWYGGGGGSKHDYAGIDGGGGGGGSSYTNSSVCSNITHTQGYQNGAGYITIMEIG